MLLAFLAPSQKAFFHSQIFFKAKQTCSKYYKNIASTKQLL
jgi:hypothetical protein